MTRFPMTVLVAVVLLSLLMSGISCAQLLSEMPTPRPTPIPTPAPTVPPSPQIELQVGQWGNGSDESVVVSSVTSVACLPPGVMGQTCAPPGTVFITASVTILNVGTNGFSVGPQMFAIRDSNGYLYYGMSSWGGSLSNSFMLAPGTWVSDTLYFTLPSTATGLSVYSRFPDGAWVAWTTSL